MSARVLCCIAVLSICAIPGCGRRKSETPAIDKTTSASNIRSPAAGQLPAVPGFADDGARFAGNLAPILDRVATESDQWNTEVFSEQAIKQLKTLSKSMRTKGSLHEAAKLLSNRHTSNRLRPNDLELIFDDGTTTVRREPGTRPISEEALSFGSAAASLILDEGPLDVQFKLFQVDQQESAVKTSVLFKSRQSVQAGIVQQNAVWHVTWENSPLPRITAVRVGEFEEITTKSGAGTFRDVTSSVLGDCESFRRQLAKGVDHWRKRLEANYGVDPNGNQGLALGDVNGDGIEDLFVCQQGGLPNRLFVRSRTGQLEDVSQAAGVDWMEMCRSALLIDLDNDGDQDLAMAQGWYLMIMENDGSGRFRVILQQRCQANLHSMCAADYDRDGDVDLFFCGRNPARELGQSEGILGTPIPYHDANNGGPNILLCNEGLLKFVDATEQVGLDQNNSRYSYAASWEDFDDDGDMDLYVANDFGRNNLYRNDLVDGRSRFHDVAAELGVEDISAGMSVSWGDYNNDGTMDVYVSNMYSSAGNRIAYQRRFREDTSDTQRQQFQRHARGNTLFEGGRHRGQPSFRDVSEVANVTMGRWAWGATFCDLNNDGWEDLYVANGFITTDDTGDL